LSLKELAAAGPAPGHYANEPWRVNSERLDSVSTYTSGFKRGFLRFLAAWECGGWKALRLAASAAPHYAPACPPLAMIAVDKGHRIRCVIAFLMPAKAARHLLMDSG
jgi:hypothetical protein